MYNLILNENMKIYKRFGTWVMVGLLILALLGIGIFNKVVDNKQANEDWKTSLASQNEETSKMLKESNLPANVKASYEQNILLNEYRIKHDIEPESSRTLWGFVRTSAEGLIGTITLFTIIIGAGIVASEFSWGTIKLLLIRPVSRWKVLLSKYISTLFFSLTLLLILFVTSVILGGVLFGFDGMNQPYLSFNDGNIVEGSYLSHIFMKYGLSIVDLIMMVTFAFMVSTVFRNSSLAIGLSIFLMFTGQQIVFMLSQKYEWVKYVLFANMNLMQYIDGTPIVKGMTMSFSVSMLLIYFSMFLFIAFFIFKKKDVSV